MSNARNLADVISGNYDVPAGALDNVDLTSRVSKTGDTMTGSLTLPTIVLPSGGSLSVKDSSGVDTYIGVDSAGRVTMPYQPAFRAYMNASQSTSITPAPFNTATMNKGSHYNASTYRFTAPVAGVYLFHLAQSYQGASGADVGCNIRKNGTSVYSTDPYTITISRLHVDSTILIELAVNDYVDVGYAKYAGTVNLEGGAIYGSQFEGYLLG